MGLVLRIFGGKIAGVQIQFEARFANATSIYNPLFRYIHRVMATTLFGRGEGDGVRGGELFFLWSMVNNQAAITGYYLIYI